MSRATVACMTLAVVLALSSATTTFAVPPTVTAVTPVPGTTVAGQPAEVTADFNQAMNAGDLNAYNFTIVGSGGDDTFGDGNEFVPSGVSAPEWVNATRARLDLSAAALPDDLYAVALGSTGSPSAGYALQFDGQNDYVVMPLLGGGEHAGPTALKYLTMEAWVYLLSNDPLQPMVVMSHGDDYTLGIQNGHAWARIEAGCGNWVQAEGGNTLPTGQWVHLAAVYDEISLRVYVNGALAAATAHTTPISYCVIEWPVYIGCQDSFDLPGRRFLHGLVDEARLWNVARTPAQIITDMYRTLTGAEAGLVGLWDFNEGSGQTLNDKSGTGNDGTLGTSSAVDSADPQWLPSTAPTGALTNGIGEPLDGEFAGTFPSGDGIAGGNFMSTFRIDTVPPQVVGVTWVDYTHVDVLFSELMAQAPAETESNYTITNSPAVLDATLDPDGVTVHLTTEQQEESTQYTLTVQNVTDLPGNPIAGNNTGQWNTPGIAPEVTDAAMVDWTHVDVKFNEDMDPTSTETPGNYTITDDLNVLSATLLPNGSTVRLETSQMSPNRAYTVTARNVRDEKLNTIVPGQNDSASWVTGSMATLGWVRAGNFVDNGVNHLRSPAPRNFTWKVKYWGGP
ncbi:MAG: hypothetical protein J7M38_04835, partial [Armatimonadetes bacterium]|nr:hypothetical protein [Armatimonadota bacterium]